jgi:dihydroorotate dehydrogenase (NAD+) catalytic subunit
MADLRVNIAGVEFKNPVIAASGTFGHGREYSQFFPISMLGGVSCKGTTVAPRLGNPPPRIAETPSGMLNSVGLQNNGIDSFIENDVPWLADQGTVIIANIAGNSAEEYGMMAARLENTAVQMIEANISCPNVKHGGAAFGISCDSAAAVTRAIKANTTKPVIVKLTPNVTSISEIAKSVEAEGADAVSLINTLTGMRIDINTRRPILRNNTGGMSGPALLPIAVRMVNECYRAVKIPIIGMGGISGWQDAVEIMMAGAAAVQIGTATINDPYAMPTVINDLAEYCDKNGIKSVSEITGSVQLY